MRALSSHGACASGLLVYKYGASTSLAASWLKGRARPAGAGGAAAAGLLLRLLPAEAMATAREGGGLLEAGAEEIMAWQRFFKADMCDLDWLG